MESRIKIFDIELDKLSPKEAMKRAMQYMESESVSSIGIVTMEMLMRGQENPKWKTQVQEMDMLLPGDREILESTGNEDRRSIRDLEEQVFLRLFFRYIERNRKKVFLLADNEAELEQLEGVLARNAQKCVIVGTAVLPADSGQEETVINAINGEEPDCILSVLSCPWQEAFVSENRALLNARLWLGCESALKWEDTKRKTGGRLKYFFMRRVFRYRVEKEKRE